MVGLFLMAVVLFLEVMLRNRDANNSHSPLMGQSSAVTGCSVPKFIDYSGSL